MRALALGLFFGLGGAGRASECVPLGTSVLLFHDIDFARITQQVDKALAQGSTRINFVVTLHYRRVPGTNGPSGFCFRHADGNCHDLTPPIIANYESQLARGLAHALSRGADVALLPHLDDAAPGGAWRNDMVFDPLVSYGGTSYAEAVVWPMARAVRAAAVAGRRAEISIQGEAGATVFHFAAEYERLLADVRAYLSADPRFKLGVSLNFNKVGGVGFSYTPAQLEAVEQLIDGSDFLGLSAYAAVHTVPLADDFNNSLRIFLGELTRYGISVAPTKLFQFSEMGLGGGTMRNDGRTPATFPHEAAAAPYSGISGPFDPLLNPWRTPVMREFRATYHAALLEFLSRSRGRMRHLHSAYLWSVSSWDPHGLYADANDYRDEGIVELVRSHNAACP